jgi:spore coat polysaccharide biosynthesis protein SpsF
VKLLVVVQARLASTRLPGKVLLPLAGAPMLQRQLERIAAARSPELPFEIAVATTRTPGDEPIRQLCRRLEMPFVSGHPDDLLHRHYQAALAFQAEAVAKIPSDCPLIDPGAVRSVLGAFLADPARHDYLSNLHPATWPDGNDVEVMTFAALETAWREAGRPFEREHTTPFLWERPERFRLGNVAWEGGRDLSMSHRLTVDYEEDYRLVAAVYAALWTPERPVFGLDEILALLDARPEIFDLNQRYAGVNWYRHHLDELATVPRSATRTAEVSG